MIQNNTMKQIVSVIDIGTTKIVALAGEKIGDVYKIIGYSVTVSTGVKRGNVYNVNKTGESIKKVIADVEKQANIKISEVYVGIAGQNIRTIINSAVVDRPSFNEIITKEEIERLKERQFYIPVNHDEKILDVIPKQIILDDNELYSTEELEGCVGKKLIIKYNIVVGKQQNISSIEKCIEYAGLKLKQIFLEPLASSRAVLEKEEIDKGVVMIDIGGGTSDIAVFSKGMLLHTAVIPFGGMAITQDIEKSFNLTTSEAENLKKNYSQAISNETDEIKEYVIKPRSEDKEPIVIDSSLLNNVVQARMEEILGFVDNEITTVAGIKDKQKYDVVITGGGSMLKHLNQLVKYCLAMDSRIGYPNIYLKSEGTENKNFANPQFSTAIGLLMLALEECSNNQIKENITLQINKNYTDKAISNEEPKIIDEEKEDENRKKPKKENNKIGKKLIDVLSDIFKNSDSEM